MGTNGTATALGPTCDEEHTAVSCYESCAALAPELCDAGGNPNGGCGWTSCADDVLFLETLLDQLQRALCFDLSRIYMTGFSNVRRS